MRPSSGDRICGHVQIDEDAAADVGAAMFGPAQVATLHEEGGAQVWMTVIERELVPSSIAVSQFMAAMGELLSAQHPALVPIRLVDREADFCVVGYEALPGAVPLQRRIEGSGSTYGLVARVAVEAARGLAHLHVRGRVHGALAPGNIVLWRDGVSLWQHALAGACSQEALAPKLRALGGDVVAPEVRQGEVPTPRSDVFAWGAVVAALATDTVGAAALAAVEDGEVQAGLLTPLIVGAVSADPADRPADGFALLQRIADAPVLDGGPAAARQAELRELAGRYVDEVQAARSTVDPTQRRRFRRTATELYPPGLEPIAGVMVAPDEPEPDPFSVPTDAIAPPQVQEEEARRVPTPAPMQITARRIEDEPARHFNPDAMTPPDGARLADLEPRPEPAADEAADGGISLPPLVMSPGTVGESGEDDFTPEPTRLPLTSTPAQELPGTQPVPIPPPPRHDDMSAEDSGFGLSAPVAERLDARSGRREDARRGDDGPSGGAAASVPSGAQERRGAQLDPEPLEEAALELSLLRAPAPSPPVEPAPRVGHTPAPIPARKAPAAAPDPEAPLELDQPAAPRPVLPDRRPAPMPPSSSSGEPVEARGPRGSTMAALIGFGATIVAIGLTIPVAEQRGGIAVLLGDRAPQGAEPDPGPSTEDGAGDARPTPPPPPTTCPDDTAALPRHDRVCIDRGEYPGLGDKPTTSLTLAEATAACGERGRRLCTAKEWREACRGGVGRRQPYEGVRKEGHCNDALRGVPQNLSRGGARETCVTPEGVFDLVGNAAEWVREGSVMGGNATTNGPSCQTRQKAEAESRDPAVGFRCCVTLLDPDADAPEPRDEAGGSPRRKPG